MVLKLLNAAKSMGLGEVAAMRLGNCATDQANFLYAVAPAKHVAIYSWQS